MNFTKRFLPLTCAILAGSFSHAQLSLQNGNLVIYRTGNGTTPISNASAEISLLEFQQDGTLVQTINLPTTGTDRLTASGSATSEGKLRYNGKFLAVTGYDAPTGVTNIKETTAAAYPRRVQVFENNTSATVNTTNLGAAFSEDNIRSAIPQADGSGVWITGHASNTSNGIWYHDYASSTTSQIVTNTNLRTVHIYNGQLYSGRASGPGTVQTVGTGLPTTGPAPLANLPAATAPVGRSFFIGDITGGTVMYTTLDSGTINKYSLVSGNWVLSGTGTVPGGWGTVWDLTGYVDGSGNVQLFGVTEGRLFSLTDANGFDSPFSATFTSLALAGTNYAFRGITYVPEPSTIVILSLLVLFGAGVLRKCRKATL